MANQTSGKPSAKKTCMCPNCGTVISYYPSAKKNNQNIFCSIKCASAINAVKNLGKRALAGAVSPFKGKKHTNKAKELIRKANYDNPHWNTGLSLMICKRGKDSPNWGRKRLDVTGENNHNWKGGTSRAYKNGYNSIEYRDWRRKVFERDDFKCQKCGFLGSKGYLTAHHIKTFAKYPDLRFDVENGITLCEQCHQKEDNYRARFFKLNYVTA